MAGLTEPDNAFLKEIKVQIGTLTEEVQELRETIEGDPRGRYDGLSKRTSALESLVKSYEEAESFRKISEEKRDKQFKFFVALLSILGIITSMLVGLNSLIGGG